MPLAIGLETTRKEFRAKYGSGAAKRTLATLTRPIPCLARYLLLLGAKPFCIPKLEAIRAYIARPQLVWELDIDGSPFMSFWEASEAFNFKAVFDCSGRYSGACVFSIRCGV